MEHPTSNDSATSPLPPQQSSLPSASRRSSLELTIELSIVVLAAAGSMIWLQQRAEGERLRVEAEQPRALRQRLKEVVLSDNAFISQLVLANPSCYLRNLWAQNLVAEVKSAKFGEFRLPEPSKTAVSEEIRLVWLIARDR